MEQKGKFGQRARIVIPFDTATINLQNIHIYIYDPEKNTYGEFFTFTIVDDTIVFETEIGGDIIISDGKLARN